MTPLAFDHAQFPETCRFQAWHKAEQAKGLVDIKFSTGDLTGATLESFFKEVNEILVAKTFDDEDF